MRNNRRRNQDRFTRRLFLDRLNPLDFMTDGQIIKTHRLDRASIYDLCEEMQDDLKKSTHRSSSLSVSLQVMIALRYYGSGSYMNVIGDAHGVSKMTVSRCVKEYHRKYSETPSVDEHLYVSRKECHALNIQGVCNSNNRFTNVVVARWPGSTHDYHIWNNCNLSMAFESGRITNGWLLGDSGYGL
ncbi:HARBI1 [Mytilus coruscus]|uniref:HARBI1 n=1 Tax=Mytilus coruscus TaxID=42192 RepID=A0A6J8BIZ4_MYTCO|nr:HARBI1 [Mytilus coruscus]